MTLFEELTWRGLINDMTSSEIEDKINNDTLTFYIGTDPTGDSLHIGHLSSLLMAKRLKQNGHHPIMVVGGATGFIGDPKATGERNMITVETLEHNYQCLHKQIETLFGFEMANNYEWTKDITIIDFLRDYGKHFNINYMINKDTVKRRLESGISYTEFSYMLLQSLDFLHLYETKNCTLQIGGQDQWGNITAGLELIRKVHGANVKCFGLTMPLITKADGTKFGKSEGDNIWLDSKKTSPYKLYQFLINAEDEKVIDYLKKLTFLNRKTIEELEISLIEEPFKREAQKMLAKEVVEMLHGQEAFERAVYTSQAFFKGDLQSLSKEELIDVISGFESTNASKGMSVIEMLVASNIASSKREAREWIMQGSIQINGQKIQDENLTVSIIDEMIPNRLIIKKGKRNFFVVDLV